MKTAPPANPAKSAAGRAARAHGEAYQAALDALHVAYRAQFPGVRVYRNETGVKVISRTGGGRFVGCFKGSERVDNEGHLGKVAVALEVKSSSADRVMLAAVKPSQADQLASLHAAGGYALVLVELEGRWWLVDWSAWRPVSLARSGSLTTADLEQVAAPVQTRLVSWTVPGGKAGPRVCSGLAPDWLEQTDEARRKAARRK